MKTAIGLMSGTSMDGIDAALIQTDGENIIKEIDYISINYEPSIRDSFKLYETTLRAAHGDVSKCLNTPHIIKLSTQLHIDIVQQLLHKTAYTNKDIDVIGYHGQTMYHKPEYKISILLGDGQFMSDQLGITVVNDFRTNDIMHDGQGAPFAPIYHQALAKRDNKIPSVVVNCGGIANITLIQGPNYSDMHAYDTGPGNGLIDRLVKQYSAGLENMDTNGKYGTHGTVNKDMIKLLYQKAIIKNNQNFFEIANSKSLDIGDMILPSEIYSLSIEDACRTLEAFTADTIIESFKNINQPIPKNWILAGGGWNNPVILHELQTRLDKHGALAQIADELGWNSKAMEAQIFAYLAVRSLDHKPLSFPNTTGVLTPVTGGVVYSTRKQI
jgi:anhydro-N-acetylmuramic acid kinase